MPIETTNRVNRFGRLSFTNDFLLGLFVLESVLFLPEVLFVVMLAVAVSLTGSWLMAGIVVLLLAFAAGMAWRLKSLWRLYRHNDMNAYRRYIVLSWVLGLFLSFGLSIMIGGFLDWQTESHNRYAMVDEEEAYLSGVHYMGMALFIYVISNTLLWLMTRMAVRASAKNGMQI